jgi:hypothetical protein
VSITLEAQTVRYVPRQIAQAKDDLAEWASSSERGKGDPEE